MKPTLANLYGLEVRFRAIEEMHRKKKEDNAKRFNAADLSKDSLYLRNLMNDLKNELPENFQLNRHAPIQDQI